MLGINECTVCYYQSTVNIMKIVEKLIAHNDLLNKKNKDKRFKIGATEKEHVPEKYH